MTCDAMRMYVSISVRPYNTTRAGIGTAQQIQLDELCCSPELAWHN